MPGSDLRRRSRNGPIRSANCRVFASCTPASIGEAQTRRKAWRLPSSPGITQSRIAQSSVRLFSIGVPVSATRHRARDRAQRLGRRGAGVLDVLGLVGDHEVPGDLGELGVADPHGAVRRQHEPPASARSSDTAACRGTGAPRRPGANRASSCSQLPSRLAGQTTSVGPAWPALDAVQVQGDQGDRLAQPHVVGQAGAEAERGELGQPGQPLPLVVAQRRRAAPAGTSTGSLVARR